MWDQVIKILAKTKQMKIMFCNVKGKVTVTGRATTHHHSGKKTTCLQELTVWLGKGIIREINVIPCYRWGKHYEWVMSWFFTWSLLYEVGKFPKGPLCTDGTEGKLCSPFLAPVSVVGLSRESTALSHSLMRSESRQGEFWPSHLLIHARTMSRLDLCCIRNCM